MTEFIPPGTRYHVLPSPFAFKRGGELRDAHVAYETWGTLDADAGNAVLIVTGLSPDAHAAANADNPAAGVHTVQVSAGQGIYRGRKNTTASNGTVVNTNTLTWLNQPGTPHQIAFVDPPFRKGLLEETLRLLENNGWLADEALIYVESEVENGLPPVPAGWHRA